MNKTPNKASSATAFIFLACLAFAIVVAGFASAASLASENEFVETAVRAYFDAAQREDWNAYSGVLLIEGNPEDTKVVVEKVWGLFDTKNVKLSNFETSVSAEKEKALSVFDVEGVIVDAETREEYLINATYAAVLRKNGVGGKWLVESAAPIDEFTAGVKDVLEIATVNTEQTHARMEAELQEEARKNGLNVVASPGVGDGGGNGGGVGGGFDFGFGFDFSGFGGSTLWIIVAVSVLAVIGALYVAKKILFNKFVIALLLIALLAVVLFFSLGGEGGTGGGNGTLTPSLHPTFAHGGGNGVDGVESSPAASVFSRESVEEKAALTREATQAYSDYIAAYNRFTDLMSQGKGDSPEAQQAYADYKAAKARYEELATRLK